MKSSELWEAIKIVLNDFAISNTKFYWIQKDSNIFIYWKFLYFRNYKEKRAVLCRIYLRFLETKHFFTKESYFGEDNADIWSNIHIALAHLWKYSKRGSFVRNIFHHLLLLYLEYLMQNNKEYSYVVSTHKKLDVWILYVIT